MFFRVKTGEGLPGTFLPSHDNALTLVSVDGGHRAVMFNRIGGVQDDVYAEGLHFR